MKWMRSLLVSYDPFRYFFLLSDGLLCLIFHSAPPLLLLLLTSFFPFFPCFFYWSLHLLPSFLSSRLGPYTTKLDELCIHVCRSPRKCVFLLAYGSAGFIGLVVLDIIGDTVGWYNALWAPLLVMGLATVLVIYYNYFYNIYVIPLEDISSSSNSNNNRTRNNTTASTSEEKRNLEGGVEGEESEEESKDVMIMNPVHTFSRSVSSSQGNNEGEISDNKNRRSQKLRPQSMKQQQEDENIAKRTSVKRPLSTLQKIISNRESRKFVEKDTNRMVDNKNEIDRKEQNSDDFIELTSIYPPFHSTNK
jgi:hypothetical protein